MCSHLYLQVPIQLHPPAPHNSPPQTLSSPRQYILQIVFKLYLFIVIYYADLVVSFFRLMWLHFLRLYHFILFHFLAFLGFYYFIFKTAWQILLFVIECYGRKEKQAPLRPHIRPHIWPQQNSIKTYTPCEHHRICGGTMCFFVNDEGSRSNHRIRPCEQAPRCEFSRLSRRSEGGIAPVSGTGDRGFESRRFDQKKNR